MIANEDSINRNKSLNEEKLTDYIKVNKGTKKKVNGDYLFRSLIEKPVGYSAYGLKSGAVFKLWLEIRTFNIREAFGHSKSELVQ